MQLVFDLDGTLIDVRSKYYQIYCAFVSEHGGQQLPMGTFWEMKRAAGSYDEILNASNVTVRPETSLREFIQANIETENYLRSDRVFAGVKVALELLRGNYKCHLLSLRRNRELFLWQVESLGLSQYFENIVCPTPLGESEVSEMTEKCRVLKLLQPTSQLMIIGDGRKDVLTGKQLNALTCAVTSGVCNAEVLRGYRPDFLIDSVVDLPQLMPLANGILTKEYSEPNENTVCGSARAISDN